MRANEGICEISTSLASRNASLISPYRHVAPIGSGQQRLGSAVSSWAGSAACWSGVGTAAICIIGMVAFNELLTAAKAIGVVMVIGGVATLNLVGAE